MLGFMLVPAHMGNKGVDNLAKNATEKQRIEFALQHLDCQNAQKS